jgi:hypothetical protein
MFSTVFLDLPVGFLHGYFWLLRTIAQEGEEEAKQSS